MNFVKPLLHVAFLWQLLMHVAHAQVYPVVIGRTQLTIPAPVGFSDGGSAAPAVRQFAEKLTPATNRLLTAFIQESSAKNANGGSASDIWGRYFLVQTLRQTEPVQVSTKDFDQVRTLMRDQYKTLIPRAATKAQHELGAKADEIGRTVGVEGLSLKIGEMRGLEILEDSGDAISLLAMTKYQVATSAGAIEVPMAIGLSTLNIKGKLVYLYAYARVSSSSDVDWVRSQTISWIARTRAANV